MQYHKYRWALVEVSIRMHGNPGFILKEGMWQCMKQGVSVGPYVLRNQLECLKRGSGLDDFVFEWGFGIVWADVSQYFKAGCK